MHSNDQYFLVVRTIEDTDPSAFGKTAGRTPEKIMLQLFGARLFEAENLAALRIDPGHDVPDGAVLTGRVHPLKNQQQRIPVGGVVKLLQRAQLRNMFFQKFLVLLFRLENGLPDRRPFFEVDLLPGAHPEILGVDFHLLPSVVTNGVSALGPPGLGRRWAQHSHSIDIAATSIIGTLADSIFPGERTKLCSSAQEWQIGHSREGACAAITGRQAIRAAITAPPMQSLPRDVFRCVAHRGFRRGAHVPSVPRNRRQRRITLRRWIPVEHGGRFGLDLLKYPRYSFPRVASPPDGWRFRWQGIRRTLDRAEQRDIPERSPEAPTWYLR